MLGNTCLLLIAKMIDPTAKLSIGRQDIVLALCQVSVHYKSRSVQDADLKLMHRVYKLRGGVLVAGSLILQYMAEQERFKMGRLHVATLTKRMTFASLYRRPSTPKPVPRHDSFLYLLRKRPITQSNLVWAMDITYISRAQCFLYLAAEFNWFTRRVLTSRLLFTLEVDLYAENVEEALPKHGAHETFNTDQGRLLT